MPSSLLASASLALVSAQLGLASPVLSSIAALFPRDDEQCYQSDYTQCSGSDLPGYFCCGEGYECLVLAGETSVLCCPEDASQNCLALAPMECITDWDAYMQGDGNEFFTTAIDEDLPSCGTKCCPFGYHCDVTDESSFVCVQDDDQSLAPGRTAAAESSTPEPTTTGMVTLTSYTQGSYPTTVTANNDSQEDDGDKKSEPQRAGIIVGATVAGFCAAAGLFVFTWIVCRRRRRQRRRAPKPAELDGNSSLHSYQKPQVFSAKSSRNAKGGQNRSHTALSSTTEAIAEKYGIRVYGFSPSPPMSQSPPPQSPPVELASIPASSPPQPIYSPAPPSELGDVLSPISPGVTEFFKPAQVIRKNTSSKDRRIKLLNISTKIPPPPAELPASPVSLRYFSPSSATAPGPTPLAQSSIPEQPTEENAAGDEKESGFEEKRSSTPRGRKSLTPSIKTFGRKSSVSPAPRQHESPGRPKSSQSNRFHRPRTPEQAKVRRSKSYDRLSFRESLRRSTASLIPMLSANFASNPRTPPPVPPVPSMPDYYQRQALRPGAGLRPPTSAVSPHPPVILAVQSNESLRAPSPPPSLARTPPLELEHGAASLPEVVTPDIMRERYPNPQSIPSGPEVLTQVHSLWRPSSTSHLSQKSGGKSIKATSSKGSITSGGSGSGRGMGRGGSIRGGDGMIGRNRSRRNEF